MLHAEILKFGFKSDVFPELLVWTYGKCDFTEDAHKLFERITQHTKVLWSGMISGHAQNGHGEEALKLFRIMKKTLSYYHG
jgi:pentatricopeptide repeat protein